jgi:hypothetical protein
MNFSCLPCIYTTTVKCNYTKHILTKAHLKKVSQPKKISTTEPELSQNSDKEYGCKFCGITYSYLANLSKHMKGCSGRDEIIKDYENKMKIYEIEIMNIKEKLINKEIHFKEIIDVKDININQLIKENENLKKLIYDANSITKTSVNALSFVSTNFKNSPVIQSFNNFNLLIAKGATTISESIVYHYKYDTLTKYIGDIIVSEYKKPNEQNQSLWNTDTSRLAYLVRESINDKPEWSVDKGGVKIKEYAIDPLGHKIISELNKFIRETNANIDIIQMEDPDIIKKMEYATLAMKDIRSGYMSEEIVKYIAKYFYLNKHIVK